MPTVTEQATKRCPSGMTVVVVQKSPQGEQLLATWNLDAVGHGMVFSSPWHYLVLYIHLFEIVARMTRIPEGLPFSWCWCLLLIATLRFMRLETFVYLSFTLIRTLPDPCGYLSFMSDAATWGCPWQHTIWYVRVPGEK